MDRDAETIMTIRDQLDHMEVILASAAALLDTGAPPDPVALRPIRLRMASAITVFAMTLDRDACASSSAPEAAALRASGLAWSALGSDFRLFTREHMSGFPQGWVAYATSARNFMDRIRREIEVSRKRLPTAMNRGPRPRTGARVQRIAIPDRGHNP